MTARIKLKEVINDLEEICNNVVSSQYDGFQKLQMDIIKLQSKYKKIENSVGWIEYKEL